MFCYFKSLKNSIKKSLELIAIDLNLTSLSDDKLNSIIKFQNGSNNLADISLTFADPSLLIWCQHLSQITHHLLAQSQTWIIPISTFQILSVSSHPNQPSILKLYLNRKHAINVILNSNPVQNDPTQILLINWNNNHEMKEEWVNLWLKYTNECIVNLYSLFNCKVTMADSFEPYSCLEVKSELAQTVENFEIDLDPNTISHFSIKFSKFKFEPNSKLLNQVSFLNQQLSKIELYNNVLLTVYFKSLNELTKLILIWSTLFSKRNHLFKIILIPCNDIKSDQTLNQFTQFINLNILNNLAENYPKENLSRLIETGLRYTLLGLQTSHSINIEKVKEGLFVQYNYARLENMFQKFVQTFEKLLPSNLSDLTILESDKEWRLIFNYIIPFGDQLTQIFKTRKFDRLTLFLRDLSKDISKYYSKVKILTKATETSILTINARMYIILKLQEIIKTCLFCLGIEAVSFM